MDVKKPTGLGLVFKCLVAWGGLATNSKKPFKINDLFDFSGTTGGPPTWCTQNKSIPDSPLVAAPQNASRRCTNYFLAEMGLICPVWGSVSVPDRALETRSAGAPSRSFRAYRRPQPARQSLHRHQCPSLQTAEPPPPAFPRSHKSFAHWPLPGKSRSCRL